MANFKYNIGIIGSGKIGGTLGTYFAQAGHSVLFSSRHPEKLRNLEIAAGPHADLGTVSEAATFGDIVLLSVPLWQPPHVQENIQSLGTKYLIDTTNYYPERDGEEPGLSMREKGLLESEWTASFFPNAIVIKAFNTISYATYKKRAFEDENRLAIPYAANVKTAKIIMNELLTSIGYDGVYVGALSETEAMQPEQALYGLEGTASELSILV